VKLYYKKYGSGKPLVILHGLFGSSINWTGLGKQFAENNTVYLVDQRNHGRSPHSEEFNYQCMSDDLLEFFNAHVIDDVILLGHSMGGKTAMTFALQHPDRLSKLIIEDISPKEYLSRDMEMINALLNLNIGEIKSRKEADKALEKSVEDFGLRRFLLQNLYWQDSREFGWRINLNVIAENISSVGAKVNSSGTFTKPTLFVRGENSDYIPDEDIEEVLKLFTQAEFTTIANAGHWIHAENPQDFSNAVTNFINYQNE